MLTPVPVSREAARRLADGWMGVAAAAVVVASIVGAASCVAQGTLATPGAGVPHPGSVEPGQVVRKVKALLRSGSLLEFSGIPELAAEDLRARSILDVTSALIPPGYLVVELDDARGHRVANLAMTPDGHFVMGKAPLSRVSSKRRE
jgi:hypothetical protein